MYLLPEEPRLEDLLERGENSAIGKMMGRRIQQIRPTPIESDTQVAIWAELIRADHSRDYYKIGSCNAQDICTYGIAPKWESTAVDLVIEKVKRLNEEDAHLLLGWLHTLDQIDARHGKPLGALKMMGYARRFRDQSRSTGDWMYELREGERD